MRWRIEADGSVADAQVATRTFEDPALESCVLDSVRALRFTAPEGGAFDFVWPFNFTGGTP